MLHRGRVVTFEQIFDAVWGMGYDDASHKLVWDHVTNLRQKVASVAGEVLNEYLENIKGVGYRKRNFEGKY